MDRIQSTYGPHRLHRAASHLHGGCRAWLGVLAVAAAAALSASPVWSASWVFTDVTSSAGIHTTHGYTDGNNGQMPRIISGGVAVGDYDQDGWDDIYVVGGDNDNALYRNNGDGTFEEVAGLAGVRLTGMRNVGPVWVDWNGDGWLDLFVGGIEGTGAHMFQNQGDGTFIDVSASTGLLTTADTWSMAASDYDKDGDVDLFTSHWTQNGEPNHLWRNNGDGTFTPVDAESGITGITDTGYDFSFTPNFADLDNDGWPDIALASDFGTSQVFRNNGNGTFTNQTGSAITDENGMGGTLGDYDNDGDLDWFVSSIYEADGNPDGGWGVTGNRLYRNRGNGVFDDFTDITGVRPGHWGWGSVFADLDNDGHQDIFHVNGWDHPLFETDPAVLYRNCANGTFNEEALLHGIADSGQGRGVAAFDYDHDGDLDLVISNNGQPARLYRNDGLTNNWLSIRLDMAGKNRQALGARLYVTANGFTQMREIQCGNNFVSQNPAEAHFGVGNATRVDLRIDWPDGSSDEIQDVWVNQRLRLNQHQVRNVGIVPTLSLTGLLLLLGTMGSAALLALTRSGRRV